MSNNSVATQGGVTASDYRHLATIEGLRNEGFEKWWQPNEYTLGTVECCHTTVDIIHTTPWDGGPWGRVGTILDHALRKDRGTIQRFFGQFDPVAVIKSEIRREKDLGPGDAYDGRSTRNPGRPFVLLGRFRDNIYIISVGVPAEARSRVDLATGCLIDCIYGVPLKWEPKSDLTTWCESQLGFSPEDGRFCMTRKDIVRDLEEHTLTTPCEWDRWIPAESANAKDTMSSVLPSLSLKCIWYAMSEEDIKVNIRSLCWGIGWHGYPLSFWKSSLKRFIDVYDLKANTPIQLCESWVEQGRLKKAWCRGV